MNGEKRQSEHSSQLLAGESRRGDGHLRVFGRSGWPTVGVRPCQHNLGFVFSEMRKLFRALGCLESLRVCAGVHVCASSRVRMCMTV